MIVRNLSAVIGLCFLVDAAFAETVTFICDYKSYADEKGLHRVEEEFLLTFLIDKEKKSAYMMGNNGSNPLSMVPNSDGISFVEVTGSGNVMTTTITNKGTSVHGRNSVLFGDLISSQYYGTCFSK